VARPEANGLKVMSRLMSKRAMTAAVALLMVAACGASVAETLELLPGGRVDGFEERSFSGNTLYRSEIHGGVKALRAQADGAASGLYWTREVTLDRWPLLRWRWQVDDLPMVEDERSKEGDDFVARVYVVAANPILFWKSRAICYVWTSKVPVGESWPNPYTDKVVMVALRSGRGGAAGWLEERRDVAADFKRHFGEVPQRLDAVAVMTDTDQSGGRATAWYEGLRFESR
jgi:hypothetical protein